MSGGSPQHLRLEHLFRRCDTNGTGFIERADFHSLCAGFRIDRGDADAIFSDLDHDGDGRISFDDFSFGFKDFLTPGSRRGSIQLGMAAAASLDLPDEKVLAEEEFDLETRQKQLAMAKRHEQAQEAWRHLADRLDKEDVRRVLSVSSDKIFSLYEELQSSDAPAHLVNQFEDVISALMTDVRKMETETKKMEEKMTKSVK